MDHLLLRQLLIPSHLVFYVPAVKQRMRSVQNIAKITSAMKMVAASKMRVAQQQTEKSRGMLTPFLTMLGDLPGMTSGSKPADICMNRDCCEGVEAVMVLQQGDPEAISFAMQLWR